jgi:nucleoside-triphosphatase
MITILSGPIHSGKTSRLLTWADQQHQVSGLAAPVRNGLKVLYDLNTKGVYPFQVAWPAPTVPPGGQIGTGKYIFSTAAFQKAAGILLRALEQDPQWLVIDEIGPLELTGQGYEPAAGRIIREYCTANREGTLLLVVRDTLLQRVLEHYAIVHYDTFPGSSTHSSTGNENPDAVTGG